MSQRIRRIEPEQVAKVMGVLYGLVALIFVPIFGLVIYFSPDGSPFGIVFALILPIVYGIGGFIATFIGASLYNFVAGKVGGIEIELE